MELHPLDLATAHQRVDTDRFAVELSPKFWGLTAAHGGYLAALLLRALMARVDEPARAPRSMTVHFIKGPQLGPAEVETELLRAGGRVSSLSARLVQGGAVTTMALAVFGTAGEGPEHVEAPLPEAGPPEGYALLPRSKVEIDHRFEHRRVLGAPPFSGAAEARIGGYSRLEAPRPIDALTVTLLCDAWWPALFPTLPDKKAAGACPTLDLTIHFRSAFPLPDSDPADYVFVDLRTALVREGYLDESCRIWSKSGRLLAQTVQHAVRLLPR